MESELTHAKLFFLASDLGAGDAVGQLSLLARGLPRDRFAVAVGTLGRADTSAAEALRAAGVSVTPLPIRNSLDFSGMRRFRAAVREANPAVLHCFGPEAVRAARLVVSHHAHGENAPRLVASAVTAPGSGFGGWMTVRQLRRADRVLATGWAEGEHYRRLRVRGERLTRINPAVALPTEAPDRDAFCKNLATSADSKLIFASGERKEAVIAFDMLRYVSPALQLVLSADGPERTAMEELGRALAFDDFRIRFTGPQADGGGAAQLAEMVLVTCAQGGAYSALAGMAAGKPVIAYHTPELAEVIDDGVTGYLVPQGDRAAIATKAHGLLQYPTTAAQMGEAGRTRTAERFGVTRMVEQHTRVYQELVG